jgi:DNA-binding beta-propeller fold protein YncE
VACDHLSGQQDRYTALVEGIKVQTMSSATAVAASSWTRNPADLLLSMLYSSRWGMGKRFNQRMSLTVGAGAGNYTVGETVKGPTDDYQFKGIVVSWATATNTLVLNSRQGLPHGTLTGQTSGCARALSSIDNLYGVNSTALYAMKTFCNEIVPDGTAGTTVDDTSASGQKNLFVASTTGFTAGDSICINFEGDRAETNTIASVDTGVKLVLNTNLTYTHTLAQADTVRVGEPRAYFDYVWDGKENAWDAIERVCKTCHVQPVLYGGMLHVIPLKNETPTQFICLGNQELDSLKVQYASVEERPNCLQVAYLDEDLDYRQQHAVVIDPEATANNEQIRKAEIELYGVTRRSQALREARYRLKRLRYVSKVIQFSMGIEHIDFEVGDVRYFAHEVIGAATGSGRIKSSTASTCTLDHPVILTGGEAILVRHADDTTETFTTANAAGEHKVISISPSSWVANPAEDDIYIIGTPPKYRIIAIKPNQEFQAEIQAEEDSASYYTEDFGTIDTFTESTLPDPDEFPPNPTDVTITESNELTETKEIKNWLQVSWERASHELDYACEVYYRMSLGPTRTYGRKLQDGESLANDTLQWPFGVCVYGDYIYFSDSVNHRIMKMSYIDFDYTAKIGSYGSGNDNFKVPMGLWTDGIHLWVADMGNDRVVKRLCSDLSYVDEVGGLGTDDGEFDAPVAIAGNSTHIFVVDQNNHRIQKFLKDLTFVSKIGSEGSGNDQFEHPAGIACSVAGDYIIVADTGNYRIVKRSTVDALTYSAKIGSQGYGTDKFCGPIGVAIDEDDTYFYVTDYGYDPADSPPILYGRLMSRTYSDLSAATAIFPNSASEIGGKAGTGDNQFSQPSHLSADVAHEGVYFIIADRAGHRIMRMAQALNQDWIYAGECRGSYLRLKEPFSVGDYITASVVPRSPSGMKRRPDAGAMDYHVVLGQGTAPFDIPIIYYSVINSTKIRLYWQATTDMYTKYYEVREGVDWMTGAVVAQKLQTTSVELDTLAGVTVTYWVKSMSALGIYCTTAKSIAVNTAWLGISTTHLPGGKATQTVNIKTG